jgi:formate dehydrogenase alpha subunit
MIDVLTTCPFCGCGCGMYLQIEKGKVTGVTSSRMHPISRGRLCARGWHVYEFIQHPDRLKKPLIRKGRSKSYRESEWNEALNLVASRLEEIRGRYGSDSLGVIASSKCTNEDNYVLMKFARAVLKTNNIDNGGKFYDAATLPGLKSAFGTGAGTNSIDQLEQSDVILVFGADPSQVHPQISARIINAVDRGAKLVLINPRKIHLSKFATLDLQIRPGMYVGFINGLIRAIFDKKMVDLKLLEDQTANLHSLQKMVHKYTPDFVKKEIGISKENLYKTAALYAKTKKAMILYSTGLTQQAAGIDNVKALANLVILTQHLGEISTGILPLVEQNNSQGVNDIGGIPDFYPGYQAVDDERVRKKFEEAWNAQLPENPGLSILEMITSGKLKAMMIAGENPLVTAPDIQSVETALKNLEFLVVQDIFFTETAQYADVVLPASCFAEKNGTFTNTERRVQKIRKAIDPPGQSKPDWMIISELADRMGYQMKYSSAMEIMEELSSISPIYAGINYSRLNETDGLQWPCTDQWHPGTATLHQKYSIHSRAHFSLVEQDGLEKQYFTPVKDIPLIEPTDKEYPFTLTTGTLYYQWHSGTMTRRSATLNREYPEVFGAMNPEDAKRLNIRNGERIRVLSRRGEIETAALLTDMVQENTIFIPFHYKDTATKMLINPSMMNRGKVPEFLCAVKVEKL